MPKVISKKIILYSIIIFVIFSIDRISKIYILNFFENYNYTDLYIFSFLNFNLIWNEGIAFGLFSFDQDHFYNGITLLILLINLIILILIIKSQNKTVYFLLIIFGGSLGNLFDRLYYSSVPDFIDFHIGDYHWFIFNVADIFISIGVICLILDEIIFNKKVDNELN